MASAVASHICAFCSFINSKILSGGFCFQTKNATLNLDDDFKSTENV